MERTGAYQADHTTDFVHHMATLYNMRVAGGSCVVYGSSDQGIGGQSGTTVGGSLRAMFGEQEHTGGWDIDAMCEAPDDDYGTTEGGCDLAQGCGFARQETPPDDYAYNLPEDSRHEENETGTYDDFVL